MHMTHIIIDDFLPEANAVRDAALKLAYPEPPAPTYFPGRNADRSLAIAGIDRLISEITGETLRPAPGTSHCKPRLALEGDRGSGGVHIDNALWSGILFLTRDEHCRGGTSFHRHERTNSERAPVFPGDAEGMGYEHPADVWDDVINPDTNRPEAWQTTMTIPMKFNRLALFRSYLWHNAGPSFGTGSHDGRLILPLFYIGA